MSIEQVKTTISKLKFHSQELNNIILTLKEKDISTKFYLSNLQKMALQALDLFNAMDKQTRFFTNQKTALKAREIFKQKQQRILNERQERKQRRQHGISVD